MALSAAERNRRKRQRKKKEKDHNDDVTETATETHGVTNAPEVEIEYVAEPVTINDNNGTSESIHEIELVLRKFEERAMVVTDDDTKEETTTTAKDDHDNEDHDDDEENASKISKRKLREIIRPSLADLKRRVKRPDLVEAHDVTAFDPEFLIELKAVPGSVPVPRHWGRKRKYLQGKRGFEKKPFELPDFIVKTGIAEVRDSLIQDEAGQSAKQKNRSRVAPKMGAIDIDYRTLHDAFFKHQSKPSNLTKVGDTYYEGKELETNVNIKPGGPLSEALRVALGMTENSPPPWLNNMQRYGPPPSYPTLRIPGLNAQLPNDQCQYGYHPGGWGKPPVDAYGRPLYGGNPFDPPGKASRTDSDALLVTSNGKTLSKTNWGALPEAGYEQREDSDEESSNDEMEESESEEEEGELDGGEASESVLPPPTGIQSSAPPLDLRKQPGDITPMIAGTQQLYQVLPQAHQAGNQAGVVFASSATYVLPSQQQQANVDGMASVLSKSLPNEIAKKVEKTDDETEKTFKF